MKMMKKVETETNRELRPSCQEKKNPQQKPSPCPSIKNHVSWSVSDNHALPTTAKVGFYLVRGTRRKREENAC